MKRVHVWLGWAAAVAVLVGGSWVAVRSRDQVALTLVNALDQPVSVSFDGVDARVAAAGRAQLRVPVGLRHVEVRGKDGRVLDRHALRLTPLTSGTAVYNVLGAAPLYRMNVYYGPDDSGPPPDPGFAELGGERFQVVHGDFLFREPPRTISVDSRSRQTVRVLVDVARGGFPATLRALADGKGGLPAAYELALRLHQAMPEDARALGWALEYVRWVDDADAAAALAREAIAAAPEQDTAHRAHVGLMKVLGRRDEVRDWYRQEAARRPGSVPVATALMRLLPRPEAEALARATLAAHPDEPHVLSLAAYHALQAGHAADAAALYARMPRGEGDSTFVEDWARALILAGRPREATAAALEVARAKGAGLSDVVLYVRASRIAPGEVAPGALVKEWAEGSETAATWVAAVVGDDPGPGAAMSPGQGPGAQTLAIVLAASRDPVNALARCRQATAAVISDLPVEVETLLALEAYRVGDRATFERLRTRLYLSAEEIAAWVERGVEPEEWWRLDAADRAALALARSRRLRAAGKPVPQAIQALLRSDPLRGLATVAAERWPPPGAEAVPMQLVLGP